MDMNNNKTILITGGCGDLGVFLGEYLFKKGHKIIVVDRLQPDNLSDNLTDYSAEYHQIDLEDTCLLDNVLEQILEKYRTIDVLINNAAIRVFKHFIDFDEQEIETYININFKSPLLLVKKILPIMKSNGYGRIINISSISACEGYSTGSLYCSTKSALIKFTESLGTELIVNKENVTVNVICPDSFRSTEGKKLQGYDYIKETIGKIVFQLINSNRNGEVIPVMLFKKKLIKIVEDFKKTMLLTLRY